MPILDLAALKYLNGILNNFCVPEVYCRSEMNQLRLVINSTIFRYGFLPGCFNIQDKPLQDRTVLIVISLTIFFLSESAKISFFGGRHFHLKSPGWSTSLVYRSRALIAHFGWTFSGTFDGGWGKIYPCLKSSKRCYEAKIYTITRIPYVTL